MQGAGTSGYAFTGREWDADTGLYYYRARYYDPRIGRFLSEDPSKAVADYGYVDANPVTFIDPSGMVRVIPRVTETATMGDKGKTFLDNAFVLWNCSGDDCAGWKPQFTVIVNLRVIYSQVCPPGGNWSRRHERRHVDQFVATITFWANAFLGPLEFKTFESYQSCIAAAEDAVSLFRNQPPQIFQNGQAEIDRYIPCLLQF